MLTEAIIQTSPPTSLKIEGADQDDLLILESISNLSRVQNSLYLGEFAREGGYYQGRRRNQLNPVFNFRLQPDYVNDVMASDIREMLYDMFLEPSRDSDMVTVHLVDDRKPTRLFTGYTETLESEIFAKELRAQVSMLTTDNYFRSIEPVIWDDPAGSFTLPIEYAGSAETGFYFQLYVFANTPTITIEGDREKMVLDGPWAAGQSVQVNTQEGFRSIIVHPGAVEDMGAMTGPSRWINLRKGANIIDIYGSVKNDGRVGMVHHDFREAWWGV